MIVKTVGLKYEAGEFMLTQGHKRGERDHYNNGRYVQNRGFGWASECRPARLTLICDDSGRREEIWIDRFFRENWGRLTPNRLSAIRATIPDEVEVNLQVSYKGANYYTVDETCMQNWLTNAKSIA